MCTCAAHRDIGADTVFARHEDLMIFQKAIFERPHFCSDAEFFRQLPKNIVIVTYMRVPGIGRC